LEIRQKIEMIEKLTIDLHKRLSDRILVNIKPALSMSHIYLLTYIRCKGSCKVTEMANHLGITLSAVTSLVDKLCDTGLVIRHRSEEDRRVVFMKLTEEGEKFLKYIDENRIRLFEKVFSNLSDEEIDSYFGITERLARNILSL